MNQVPREMSSVWAKPIPEQFVPLLRVREGCCFDMLGAAGCLARVPFKDCCQGCLVHLSAW